MRQKKKKKKSLAKRKKPIPIVDIFAGPGGLGEGFSALDGRRFRIAVSAEMDTAARETLKLRAYFRALQTAANRKRFYYPLVSSLGSKFEQSLVPDHRIARDAFVRANNEALRLELGVKADDTLLRERVAAIARSDRRWVLIGGPPCQAYSIAGRARNKGVEGYAFEKDKRTTLYKHYLALINDFGPAVFVMENVRGMLSAKVRGESVFGQIMSDLRGIRYQQRGYEIFSLNHGLVGDGADPGTFLVKAEDHGIPQARHRVIILGVRDDVLKKKVPGTLEKRDAVSLESALVGLPSVRSSISRRKDKDLTSTWQEELKRQFSLAAKAAKGRGLREVANLLEGMYYEIDMSAQSTHSNEWKVARDKLPALATVVGLPDNLADWLLDPRMPTLQNHHARAHMSSDLARYAFASSYRHVHGTSPTSRDFPEALAPDHKNWDSGAFADRFFVQPPEAQCSTVTSHIAKDGHHFIHWDPLQCRSLTVREAARAQTFPDNYVFLGNRTQQFTQVGNAVPPYLALQIARIVRGILVEPHG